MTNHRYTQIAARPYALRFDPMTPDAVIEATVREANELLTAQVPGLVFFPFEWKEEVIDRETVKAVHLHADAAGWDRFKARGTSTMPLLTRRVETVVARRRTAANLGQMDLAMAS